MSDEYTVSVACNFTATSPTDAVRKMVDWLADHAKIAGYHVITTTQHSTAGAWFIDAEETQTVFDRTIEAINEIILANPRAKASVIARHLAEEGLLIIDPLPDEDEA
jgi:hypothetical protein